MYVTILDLEWYNHTSFVPNPKCMKISSYHKQKKDIVNFVTDSSSLLIKYDRMYIVRESITGGGFPEEVNLLDEKVFLIGEGLKYYNRYMGDIDPVIASCRPDYLLYPIKEENKMSKANIVQFFSEGKLLPLIQNYKNAYTKAQYTYVVDKNFWHYNEKDIKKCCEKLKFDKDIVFADPIDLNLIFQSKTKFELLKKLKIDWRKSKIKVTLQDDKDIQNFYSFVDSVKPSMRCAWDLTCDIVYGGDHYKKASQWLIDFNRYFNLIVSLKKKRVHIHLKAPDRLLSPRWFYFEDLEGWTLYGQQLSFVEYMTYWACKTNGVSVDYVMRHSMLWNDSIHRLVVMWKYYPEIMEAGAYCQWQDRIFQEVDIKQHLKEKK